MNKLAAFFAVLMALMGCQPEVGSPSVGGLNAAQRAECVAQGGTVAQGGIMPGDICFKPTADAGKACKKASDCSALCMADTLTCSAMTPQLGCFGMMGEDGKRVDLCVD